MAKKALLSALTALLLGCQAAPPRPPVEPDLPPLRDADIPSSGRIKLRGNTIGAPVLRRTVICGIPFGRQMNAITLETQKGGVMFAVSPEDCSEAGCIIESSDPGRVIVARQGVADALMLELVDHGWNRHGISSISDGGWLALPVANKEGQREIWVLDSRFRLRHRIPHAITMPLKLKWRTDELFVIYGSDTYVDVKKVDLARGRMASATPMEPWWSECPAISASPYAAGFEGENPNGLSGRLTIPLWRRGEALPVLLEMGSLVHPPTPDGVASPVRVTATCDGRICVVTALSENIWCMRFKADGELEAFSQVLGSIAGDAKTIQVDRRGRFYYIETILDKDQPTTMNLVVLE